MPQSNLRKRFLKLCILVLCCCGKNSAFTPPRPAEQMEESMVYFPQSLRCRTGWLQFDKHCIKLFSERKSWSEARGMCRALEGDLVTIHDEKKQNFVYNTFAVGKTLWIGLKRDDQDVFHWVDGTKLQYTNWVSGSPDDLSEKCGEMTDYGPFRGKWNDKDCQLTTQPFICEIAISFSNVFKIFPGKMLLGHVISSFTVASDLECLLRCQRYPGCQSTNFVRRSSKEKKNFCELNGRTEREDLSQHLYTEELSSYYDLLI